MKNSLGNNRKKELGHSGKQAQGENQKEPTMQSEGSVSGESTKPKRRNALAGQLVSRLTDSLATSCERTTVGDAIDLEEGEIENPTGMSTCSSFERIDQLEGWRPREIPLERVASPKTVRPSKLEAAVIEKMLDECEALFQRLNEYLSEKVVIELKHYCPKICRMCGRVCSKGRCMASKIKVR